MKNSIKSGALLIGISMGLAANAQSDSLGLPGDNLDLKAVLSIFKQSSNLEDFEKRLNSADSKVNNLDLNSDGQVDYLRVADYGKEDFHTIVIQDPVSKTESQDVAVIQVVKKGDNTAHLQIVGDETLYGKDYIIEPSDQKPLENSTSDRNNTTNDDVYADRGAAETNRVMVNVWTWPSVSYIYSPGYSYWVSPWYWGYYPGWYSPWRPCGWHVYHRGWIGYNYGFYGYRRHYYAFPHAHSYYYGRRMSSGYVQKTAPNYGRRQNASYNSNRRDAQQRNKTSTNNRQQTDRVRTNNSTSQDRKQNKTQSTRSGENKQNRTQRTNTGKPSQKSNGTRVNSAPHSKSSGGAKSGGSRSSGGGRTSGGGATRSSGGR